MLTTPKRQGKGWGAQRKEELLLTKELVEASTNEAACELRGSETGGGPGAPTSQSPVWLKWWRHHTCMRPHCVLPTDVSYWQTALLSPFLSLTGDPTVCSISNPDFVIYSSVVSFYLPFGVTVLVYARIYVVLRQRRRKRILTRQNSQCISVRPGFPQQVSTPGGQRENSAQPCSFPALCPAALAFARAAPLETNISHPPSNLLVLATL